MSPGARRAAALLSAFAIATAGCEGSDDDEPPPQRPVEAIDPLPKLPAGWEERIDYDGGLAVGLPRGWRASERGTALLIRSFDRLVAISIAPDRTNEALELDLGEFATRAAESLAGYERGVERISPPRPYEHAYEGAFVRGRGTSTSGVEQDVTVAALRRPGLVELTVVIAVSATAEAAEAKRLAARVVRTLRTRPPAGTAP